jgi:hypothetical protein
MAGQIKVRFKNFQYVDFSSAARMRRPGAQSSSDTESSVIQTGLQAASYLTSSKTTGRIRSLLALATPPATSFSVLGSIPGLSIASSPHFTVTFGMGASAGAAFTAGAAAGIYYWNKAPYGQLGLYGSISAGIATNAGASFGDYVTYLFGPAASVLAGDSIALSVDVGIGAFTVTGQLILSAPPVTLWPPSIGGGWTPQIIGIGFGLSVGISVLPVDISVMPGRTWIKPVTP